MQRASLTRRFTLLFATFFVMAFAGAALAQTDVTTSRMAGVVRDADGGQIPGVTVTAKNQDTGLTAVAVSGAEGAYRLINLPTGMYTVTASLTGFNSAVRPDIRLILGSAPTVDFTLQLSAVSESLTVVGTTPVIEVTNTSASTTIQTEQIESLPLNGRNFTDLVLLTPTTRRDSERGNLSISGQRGINTNVTVDGVDYNNAFFGGTTGAAEGRAPLAISQESIKEFTVITNGASVEFGRSGGGFVNVITKSGTNNFHGSGFFYWQPESLIADFSDGSKPADQDKKQYGLSFGGPLMQDKLFFFASYDQQTQDITVPVAAAVLDADIAARYPVLASDPTYVQTKDGRVIFGRLDLQATATQRFMLRGNFTTYEGDNGTSGSQTRSSKTNGLEGLDSQSYVASYSGQFGDSLLNDFNATYVNEDTPREDKSPTLPEIRYGSFTYGGVSFLPIVSTTERIGLGDTVTFLVKNHVLKAGVEYNDTSIEQVFKGNWRGVYVFDGSKEADFVAGKWTQYFQFGGLGGLTSDEAGKADFGQKELALFVQDQWFATSTLTISAGVRWERLDNPDAPVLNQNDMNSNGSFNLTGKIPDSTNQWSPRVGASWSPGDGKTVMRFSAGRFWSRTPAILLAQLYTSNGLRGTQYTINAPAGKNPTDPGCMTSGTPPRSCYDPLAPGWGATFNPEGVERIDFTRVPTPSRLGVFAIDPDFENPRTDRVTLGFERELFRETAAGLEFTYAKTENLQRLTDINLQYDGTLAANGLPRYSSTRPNSFYGRITTSVSDAESKFYAVTANFRRRFMAGLSANAYVTWSKDKDSDSNERNFAGVQAEDVNDLDGMWGYSSRDQRWKGGVNASWDTPWWGIGISGLFRYAEGSPFNAVRGDDTNNDGFRNDRPTIDGVHFERNSFRQPNFYTLDFRLGKSFVIGAGKGSSLGDGEISIFAECFNCTDRDNSFVTNTTYGTAQVPSSTFGIENGVGQPRTIQVALRFDF